VLAERDIRQGWYFYYDNGEILRLTWSKLPESIRKIVLDKKPCYAANPGKG